MKMCEECGGSGSLLVRVKPLAIADCPIYAGVVVLGHLRTGH